MISGVLLILLSEGLLLRSAPHIGWAGIFAGLNELYIPLVEEPALRRRFGPEFDDYARHVPRNSCLVSPLGAAAQLEVLANTGLA